MTLYRVTLPHLCAGLLADPRGIVRRAAPILAWTCGKPEATVRAWVERKGGTREALAPREGTVRE